jgi:hypothetical protein
MDEKLKIAVDLYKSGKSLTASKKEAHVEEGRLKRELIQQGIFRSRAEQIRKGKSDAIINDNALDRLTPDALYWIGFILSDGHIEKDRTRITVTLTKDDENHLLKMGEFFGEGLIPRIVKGTGNSKDEEYLRLAFSSKRIYEKLTQLGLHHRKTWDINIHENLQYSRDFWRGVIDGDGWIYNKQQRCIGLSGHETTIQSFLDFVNWSGIQTKTNPYKVKTREYLWTCDLHSNIAKKTADLLYKDATVYLDRKYDIYKSWLSE